MPELKCTVQTCVHNKQFLCDLEKIQVGGSDAKTPRETCCDSFQERKDQGYMNSASGSSNASAGQGSSGSNRDITGKASDLSGVDCKATECTYNENRECHAGKISVEGSNADQRESTECATFQYRG